jgi:hypothetical protein
MPQTATTINILHCRAQFILRGHRHRFIWARTYHASDINCASREQNTQRKPDANHRLVNSWPLNSAAKPVPFTRLQNRNIVVELSLALPGDFKRARSTAYAKLNKCSQ